MNNKGIVICDIDGTISRVGDRLKYLQQNSKDWDSFYNDCFNDEPIQEMVHLICNLQSIGYRIIFCTGRRESVRIQTENWIRRYTDERIFYPQILMRPNNDHRHDTWVKPNLLEKFLTYDERAHIAFILEDRDSMVAKWRELGYRCLQVDNGNF